MNTRIQMTLLTAMLGALAVHAEDEQLSPRPPIFDIGVLEVPEGDSVATAEFLQELTQLQADLSGDYRAAVMKIRAAQAEAANKVLKDPNVSDQHFATAARIGLSSRVREIGNQTPDEKREVLEMVRRQLAIGVAQGVQRTELANAASLVSYLERSGDSKLAVDACRAFIELLEGNDDRNAMSYLSRFKGLARRLNLLGNPIELTGKTVDGNEFNWDEYEGKVVLVDFWATWCGPCLAEAPNVRKNYDKYHDRGFEVVGISLDNQKSSLESYLKKKNVPWVNLFESGAGWKHPMAVKYGVNSIPTVFLVNREGNVVSLRARGAELGKQLKALLETKEDLEREIAACTEKLEESPGNPALLSRRALAYIDTEQWNQASADWQAAIDKQPDLAVKAVNSFKELKQWDRAADFAMATVQQDPDDVDQWLKVAPIFARCSDSSRYREFCQRMVKHFKDSDDWRECRVTSKSCLLRPGGIAPEKLPQKKIADGFDGEHTAYTLGWSWSARALLAYRNGDARSALKYLEESEKHRPVAYAKALNYPLFALVHHRLGNEAKAAASLNAGELLLNQLNASETSKHHHDVLIAGIIFDEAKTAISGQPE